MSIDQQIVEWRSIHARFTYQLTALYLPTCILDPSCLISYHDAVVL